MSVLVEGANDGSLPEGLLIPQFQEYIYIQNWPGLDFGYTVGLHGHMQPATN